MHRRILIAIAALLIAAALPFAANAQQRDNALLKAKTWAYQLRNLGAEEQKKIAASPFDLVIIDSEQFPDDQEIPLTREEVERMKVKPDGSRRLVLAYFSIGEAEGYRYYWKPEWNRAKPAWVGKENKEWKENFLVKYWEPTWQSIVYGSPTAFADRILAAGFDGFYLDRVDAYYYYGDTKEMRDRMAAFVIKLTNYLRSKKPDVSILVQNAEELLDRPDFVAAIDGIAKEDLLYGITHREEPNKKADVDWSINLLKPFRAKSKAVFVVEYLTRTDYVRDAKAHLDALDFVMYMGPRGLAALNMAAADIGNYAGPRRGPLDPTPDNPSASTPLAKAKAGAVKAIEATRAAAAKAVERTKAVAAKAAAKVKEAAKPAQPAKKN